MPVAIHCVTAAQLVVAVAALRVGANQPTFSAERGDQYRTDVPETEQDQLWRLASLLLAGVPVALSTDAPFGDSDPWAAVRVAVHRRSFTGSVLNAAECVDARTALTLFLGSATPARPRTIAPGQLDAGLVAATVIDGATVFTR